MGGSKSQYIAQFQILMMTRYIRPGPLFCSESAARIPLWLYLHLGVLDQHAVPTAQCNATPVRTPSMSPARERDKPEMPRSRPTAVQSERTRRRAPRALTSPASWIAPPNSSDFSVGAVQSTTELESRTVLNC